MFAEGSVFCGDIALDPEDRGQHVLIVEEPRCRARSIRCVGAHAFVGGVEVRPEDVEPNPEPAHRREFRAAAVGE